MDYVLKIMNIEEESRDMRKFVVVRPSGFIFQPGKSVLVSINKLGEEDNKKLCTFFSLNSDYYLELVFKEDPSKPENFPFFNVKAGEELIMSDIVGNLEFRGKGAFISAGKGVIPFLNIFLHLKKMDALQGNTLIYFTRSQEEILFPRMLNVVFRNNSVIIIGRDPANPSEVKKLDEIILRQKLPNLQQNFYVAGPKYFVENAAQVLNGLNISPQLEILE